MKTTEIGKLIALQGKCSYHDANKAEFRRLSAKLLRKLRTALGVDADIRYNAGGIAVSGDATLHGDSAYVTLNADGISSGLGILYRSCEGRKDYCGGTNRWFPWARLENEGVEGLARAVSEV